MRWYSDKDHEVIAVFYWVVGFDLLHVGYRAQAVPYGTFYPGRVNGSICVDQPLEVLAAARILQVDTHWPHGIVDIAVQVESVRRCGIF